jgi:hypothetical protein
MSASKDREDQTSAGVPWHQVPEHARQDVDWIDGRHGASAAHLPSLEAVPVPRALTGSPVRHPKRPTGSKAMLDAGGAKRRLADARPGAWLISPFTGWKWAKWADGAISWVPAEIELPAALRVDARNDIQ